MEAGAESYLWAGIVERSIGADRAGGLVSDELHYGDLVIDIAARSVVRGRQRIHLTLREFKIVYVLARAAGQAVTDLDLLRYVWGHGYEGHIELLRVYVHDLRRKLGDSTVNPRIIKGGIDGSFWMGGEQRARV